MLGSIWNVAHDRTTENYPASKVNGISAIILVK